MNQNGNERHGNSGDARKSKKMSSVRHLPCTDTISLISFLKVKVAAICIYYCTLHDSIHTVHYNTVYCSRQNHSEL